MATDAPYPTAAAPIGVLTAVRRHWVVALVPVVVFVALAVALALERRPEYTATASISVGSVFNSNPAAIASVIQGTESLASVYSRLIDANAVKDGTRRRLGGAEGGHVSATPIPDSPVIRVTATADSARGAVALANAASSALTGYVNRRNRSVRPGAGVASEYERASRVARRRLSRAAQLKSDYDTDPTDENERAWVRAAAAADKAVLERDGLAAAYGTTVQGPSSNGPLEMFARSTRASSDRIERLQILVFAALVGGLLAGAALALLRGLRAGPA